ncbi:MAG: calcium-binding EGF-like domain-containing protein, partial [Myxococcota bacterium]
MKRLIPFLFLVTTYGCSASDDEVAGCVENATRSCPCTAELTGVQVCGADGTYSTCECGLECEFGFVQVGFQCQDTNECADGSNNCGPNATCTNTEGGFSCACNLNYVGDGVTCNFDECSAGA